MKAAVKYELSQACAPKSPTPVNERHVARHPPFSSRIPLVNQSSQSMPREPLGGYCKFKFSALVLLLQLHLSYRFLSFLCTARLKDTSRFTHCYDGFLVNRCSRPQKREAQTMERGSAALKECSARPNDANVLVGRLKRDTFADPHIAGLAARKIRRSTRG